ncbi:MAG: PAS domain-containing sensor histidine kinase [Pyrinomonadaceae bacterium]|nr:PAS domain-containing sensor histidine kinase [Pyrinomonadaceae bacterium]
MNSEEALTQAPSETRAHASTSSHSAGRIVTRRQRGNGVRHEHRVTLMALTAGLPGSAIALWLLWSGSYTAKVQLTLTMLIVGVWAGAALALRGRVARPLQTISNLLAALREGDYSIRARGARRDDALGEVMIEVNALGETLREQRLGALEATALLRTVMAEIDVAIFAFDPEDRLQLVNRAGERLLAQPLERLLGRSAAELGLASCLRDAKTETLHTYQMIFPGDGSLRKWGVRRSTFREHGLPHQLLVLSDLSQALREEEAKAWQRLVRVLGHELNNSLTPIKSIAGSLTSLLGRKPRPTDWQEDMERGLVVISTRSESLSRFMSSYARLARLPPPRLQPVMIGALLRRIVGLEMRLPTTLVSGPEITIQADPDQLEQLLINLLRNAVDAALETGGSVRVGWIRNTTQLEVWVEDEGLGLAGTANLFVPFFTTKPNGSGIGLVLSRQIAEAHGGTLTLENRQRGPGCEARLRLPI